MSQPSFKQTVAEMRRGQILAGAAQVFAARGFHQATTKEIAQAAGMAEGTIYNYFKNKRALLFALLELVGPEPVKALLQDNPPDDPRQFFTLLLQERFQFLQTYGHLIGPIVAEVFTDSTLRDELYQQVLRPAVDMLEAYLQAQVAAGKFRPCNPMLISRAIVGAAWFNSTLKLAQIDARYADLTPEAMIESLVDWLVAGLCE